MIKSKIRTIFILLSIVVATMFAFTFSLIRESSSNDDSNISVNSLEKSQSYSTYEDDISLFTVEQSSLDSNSVTYNVKYNEENVWYWDQSKDDYVAPNWSQYEYDEYYYGPEVSISESETGQGPISDDSYLPTFSIEYTNDRTTHWEEGDDGVLDESHGGDEGVESDDDIEVDDPYPYPPSFNGWTRNESYNSNRIEYSYTWDYSTTEMSNFPSVNDDGWELTSTDEGEWNQYNYDHWNWTSTHGYWGDPTRTSLGTENKAIWIDWEVDSQGNIEQTGKENVNTNDEATTDKNTINDDDVVEYSATDEEQRSPEAPTVTVPEPNDSDPHGVEADQEFTISNLSHGWEYDVSMNLMYEDEFGNEKTYGTFDDNFILPNDEPEIITSSEVINDTTIDFSYQITDDDDSSRITPVNWELKDSTGTIIDSGSSNSNYFEKSFDNLLPGETYTFTASFDYKSAEDNDYSIESNTLSSSTSNTTLDEIDDESYTISNYWVSNIQDDSYVLNMDIYSDNDFDIKYSDGLGFDVNEQEITFAEYGIEVHPGTNSIVVPTTLDVNEGDITVSPIINDHTTIKSSLPGSKDYNLDTNLDSENNIFINTVDSQNNSATVYYDIEGDLTNTQSVMYKFDDQDWRNVDNELITGPNTLQLNNLDQNSSHSLQMKIVNSENEVLSNSVSFKTDSNTTIGNLELESTFDSVILSFDVDNYRYLIDDGLDYFEWGIKYKDSKDDKFIKQGSVDINSNGRKTYTIDDLKPDTEYEVVVNVTNEDETLFLNDTITTEEEPSYGYDISNSAYITNVDRQKNDSFNVEYKGQLKYISYIDENGNLVRIDDYAKISNGVVNVNAPVTDGEVTFSLNGSTAYTYTWYEEFESDLVYKPVSEFSWLWFWISISILFFIITIVIVGVWAIYWRKTEKRTKTNIWH